MGIRWVHGDYTPGNIFVELDSFTVAGVIDLELAAPNELPQLDLIQFFVATQSVYRQCEYGDVIRSLLTTKDWQVQDLMLLGNVQADLPGGRLTERELVLLCWLRHVTSNVTKSEQYAYNWWWKVRNIEAVLVEL